MLLVTCVLTPFNVAFMDNQSLRDSSVFKNMNLIIDFFFMADIIVNCNTALELEETSVVIDERCKIFVAYLKSWLLIDIISILPFEVIIAYFSEDGEILESSAINVN
jgi:hypothetical protein